MYGAITLLEKILNKTHLFGWLQRFSILNLNSRKIGQRRGLIFIFEGNPGCGNHEKVAGNK